MRQAPAGIKVSILGGEPGGENVAAGRRSRAIRRYHPAVKAG